MALGLGLAGCVTDPAEPEVFAEEEAAAVAAAPGARMVPETEQGSLLEVDVGLALPAEAGSEDSPGDDKVSRYCCQIWIVEEPAAFLCDSMKGWKAWARTRCYAAAATVPFSYPVLASGSCDNYRPGICPG